MKDCPPCLFAIMMFMLMAIWLSDLRAVRASTAARSAPVGSDRALPDAVRRGFAQITDPLSIRSFEVELEFGHREYEITYVEQGVDKTAAFTADGDLIEIEHTLAADALPRLVRERIAADWPGARIMDAEQMNIVLYEIRLAGPDEHFYSIEVDPLGIVSSTAHALGGFPAGDDDSDDADVAD